MIPLVPLVFLPKGKVFESAIEGAVSANQVTPALTAAFHDPVVDAAHIVRAGRRGRRSSC